MKSLNPKNFKAWFVILWALAAIAQSQAQVPFERILNASDEP